MPWTGNHEFKCRGVTGHFSFQPTQSCLCFWQVTSSTLSIKDASPQRSLPAHLSLLFSDHQCYHLTAIISSVANGHISLHSKLVPFQLSLPGAAPWRTWSFPPGSQAIMDSVPFPPWLILIILFAGWLKLHGLLWWSFNFLAPSLMQVLLLLFLCLAHSFHRHLYI